MLSGVALFSAKHLVAEDGAYVVATQAPGAVSLVYGVQTTFADTAALLLVQNTAAAIAPSNPTPKRLYLDYVRLIVAAVPASAAAGFYAVKIDNQLRTPTANSATLTLANVNMGQRPTPTPVGKAFAASGGTLTIPAATGDARVVAGNGMIRGALPVVNDELVIAFGATDLQSGDQLGGTAPLRIVSHAPAVILDAQQSAAIYVWFPGNITTPLSYLVDVGFGER